MTKNHEDSMLSYISVESVPYEEEETDYEEEAHFFRQVDIVLSVLLIISLLTTVWVLA